MATAANDLPTSSLGDKLLVEGNMSDVLSARESAAPPHRRRRTSRVGVWHVDCSIVTAVSLARGRVRGPNSHGRGDEAPGFCCSWVPLAAAAEQHSDRLWHLEASQFSEVFL